MLRLTLFYLLFFFTTFSYTHAMSIQQALDVGVVEIQIGENETGTHYSAPLVMTLKNLSNQNLDLELDNGTLLIADDEEEQNFIITNELMVKLKPYQKEEAHLYAMCIEQSDAAPGSDSKYTIGELANEKLRRLSTFIEANKNFEPDAQFLMWDIAEGRYDLDQLDDFELDEDGIVWVVDVVGNENGEEGYREVINRFDDEGDLEVSKPKLIVNGSFEMSFGSSKNVHIAMFNGNNVIVKELYKNPSTPVGKTTLNYEFNSYDYEEEEYFVKLVVNGEVWLTRTIDMRF